MELQKVIQLNVLNENLVCSNPINPWQNFCKCFFHAGTRLDTYADAEALRESQQTGFLPFFREKPQMLTIVDGQEAELSCLVVGEPKPLVQWFK